METLFLWKSFPRPCKRVIVTTLKTQKQLWKFRPIRKCTIPILRIVKEYQTNIRTKNNLIPQVERFIKTEMTGTAVTTILGDDPYLYTEYGLTFNQLAIRLLFQSIVRDMYVLRLVENIVHLQHALVGLNVIDKIVHFVVPVCLYFVYKSG